MTDYPTVPSQVASMRALYDCDDTGAEGQPFLLLGGGF